MAKKFKHTIVQPAGSHTGHLTMKYTTLDDIIYFPDLNKDDDISNPDIVITAPEDIATKFYAQDSEVFLTFKREKDTNTLVRLEILAVASKVDVRNIYDNKEHNDDEWTMPLITTLPNYTPLFLWAKITYSNGEVRLDPVKIRGSEAQAYYTLKPAEDTNLPTPGTTVSPISKRINFTINVENAEGIKPVITITSSDGTERETRVNVNNERVFSVNAISPYVTWSVFDPTGYYRTASGTETTYTDMTKTIYLARDSKYADLSIAVSGIENGKPVNIKITNMDGSFSTIQTTSFNAVIGPIRIPHGTYDITSDTDSKAYKGITIDSDRVIYMDFAKEKSGKFIDMYSTVPAIFQVTVPSTGNVVYRSTIKSTHEKVTEDTLYQGNFVLSAYPGESLVVEAMAEGYTNDGPQNVSVGQVYVRFIQVATSPPVINKVLKVSDVRTLYLNSTDVATAIRAEVDYPFATRGTSSYAAYYMNKNLNNNLSYYHFENLEVPLGYEVTDAKLKFTIQGMETFIPKDYAPSTEEKFPARNKLYVYGTSTGFNNKVLRPASEGVLLASPDIFPETRTDMLVSAPEITIDLDPEGLIGNGVNVIYMQTALFNLTSTQLRANSFLPYIKQESYMTIASEPVSSIPIMRLELTMVKQ